MPAPKKEHPKEKARLHPRNKHRERYDFKTLIAVFPGLASFVSENKYGDESIDFFNPEAVKMLNKALLLNDYGIAYWDIPPQYLCPPIPGRADYIHHIADLLAACNKGKIPLGKRIHCLDTGTGANCVYPIIGNKEYGWSFTGSDIDPVSIASANKIVELNPSLKDSVEIRLQKNANHIFQGIIREGEFFDLAICNPPFHASREEAQAGSLRKLSNLKQKRITKADLNFGGQQNELWCEGGEAKFLSRMIRESKAFAGSCFWFSSLVSKESNLKTIYEELNRAAVFEVKTIPMSQGNKASRFVAWTFLDLKEQEEWVEKRWM